LMLTSQASTVPPRDLALSSPTTPKPPDRNVVVSARWRQASARPSAPVVAVMLWSIRVAAFCASLAVASCGLPPWIGHRPVFPSGGATRWEIPLHEPLTGLGPRVIATVCGAASGGKPRRCEEALLYVDSGSSHSA